MSEEKSEKQPISQLELSKTVVKHAIDEVNEELKAGMNPEERDAVLNASDPGGDALTNKVSVGVLMLLQERKSPFIDGREPTMQEMAEAILIFQNPAKVRRQIIAEKNEDQFTRDVWDLSFSMTVPEMASRIQEILGSPDESEPEDTEGKSPEAETSKTSTPTKETPSSIR